MTNQSGTKTLDDQLEHFGVRGMKWGIRKDRSSSGTTSDHSKRNKALKIGAGVAVIAGVGVATAILAKNGNLPIRSIKSPGPQVTKSIPKPSFTLKANKLQAEMKSLASEMKANSDTDTRRWYQELVQQSTGKYPLPTFDEYKQFLSA